MLLVAASWAFGARAASFRIFVSAFARVKLARRIRARWLFTTWPDMTTAWPAWSLILPRSSSANWLALAPAPPT